MKRHLLTVCALILVPALGHAQIECSGTVGVVGVEANGNLLVALLLPSPQGLQNSHSICNVVSQTVQNPGSNPATYTTFSIDPLACRAALSTLLTSRSAVNSASAPSGGTGALVKIKYGSTSPSSCSTTSIPLWSYQPSANMVRIVHP